MPGRLKLLLAVHLVLGMAPAAMFLHPGDLRWMPLTWALASISLGQLMLVGVWAGLAASTATRRWLGMLAAVAYLATWPALAVVVAPQAEGSVVAAFVMFAGLDAALLLVSTGIFLLMRRTFAQLVRVNDEADLPAGKVQFSVLQVLIVTSIVAMVLALARAVVGSDDASIWPETFGNLLAVLCFVVNMIASAWAALAPGKPWWRVALVFGVALVLGMAVSFTALFQLSMPEWRLWLFSTQSLAFAIPPVIMVLSLLVVRSAGYRLAPKAHVARLMELQTMNRRDVRPRPALLANNRVIPTLTGRRFIEPLDSLQEDPRMAITAETLNQLAKFDTPTICNVIELFEVRPRTEGFMNASIVAGFPEMPPMVGFASTASFRSSAFPGKGDAYGSMEQQVEDFAKLPGPAVVVFQDLDDPAVGATFGEVMCSTYKAFGSVGLITSGGGRDLLQVKALDYPVFTGSTICAHACCHILHVGMPVRVGGLVVNTADLLHGDANGVTNIPHDIATEVANIAQEFVDAEKIVLDYVNGSGKKSATGLSAARKEYSAVVAKLVQRVKK